ncbi:lantibiotic ABC transporter permease [Cereibacter changlensis JA139]|uniref:Lantibiotic ABC transporter permease n=2 Tax=Cereibacter changlensis TaxID=402884 RepID=A0A2T4JSQ4_9RHOB|nr:sugar ABC transporter ATP-binding protein [Cereibacter changlensis]PTE20941.1 lantibiotic ABC transporter permease [Cereibacter changlensis JA139]PZX56160.1 ribose transport system ATP-binding protein [Cereibacter changlensis]
MAALIQLEDITKSFAGIHALTNVDFDLHAGEVHALCGENGAGKSTLMRVLGGEMRPDSGRTLIGGAEVRLSGPTDAIRRGISVIHQEMALAPDLSVAENIFLGALPPGINWPKLRARARALIQRLGFDIAPGDRVCDLSVAHQQVVEIAKALSRDAQVIVFDEPTAVLSTGDARRLLQIIKDLRAAGVGIVYISHRLDEIYEIADRVTVMKDGRRVDTVTPASTPVDELIRMMVGRPLSQLFGEKPKTELGEEVLRLSGVSLPNGIHDVSFSIRRGEVVGLGGLVGSGRTELARAIFGADPVSSGEMFLHGAPYRPRSPRQAVRRGVGLVPEDRKGQGIVLDMEILKNATMANTAPVTTGGFFRGRAERGLVQKLVQSLRIKLGSMHDPVSSLSGGNQQKVVLAKWFNVDPDLIILDEPTRGVDVGAKTEIYTLIHRLAADGKAVIVISSEHAELFGLCDRVLVMGEGELRGELMPIDFEEEKLLTLSMTRRQPASAERLA